MHCTPTITTPPVRTLAPYTHIDKPSSFIRPVSPPAIQTKMDPKRKEQRFVRDHSKLEKGGGWQEAPLLFPVTCQCILIRFVCTVFTYKELVVYFAMEQVLTIRNCRYSYLTVPVN